ncbi:MULTISPECIES: hypothetical protein [unclassified Microcoleus]|uniref:hypothetical protein n=1 Tax=unclassified Microcoleus TaxID=2642155 RepID=UPI0025EA3313|nr:MULTISPECIES: hypothetical protein [unclassified Microcoleus]
MAGKFVLWRIALEDKNEFLKKENYKGSVWSELAHKKGTLNGDKGEFPGWTDDSRKLINQVRNGDSKLQNRDKLPPHRYLLIPGGKPTPAQLNYLRTCYWINDLVRPRDPGFGIVALASEAAEAWSAGNKFNSLVKQIEHGTTSIEIYYLGDKEMY